MVYWPCRSWSVTVAIEARPVIVDVVQILVISAQSGGKQIRQ
jgi:hypothetical protein